MILLLRKNLRVDIFTLMLVIMVDIEIYHIFSRILTGYNNVSEVTRYFRVSLIVIEIY